MAKTRDPLTPTRRERFRALCLRRGWISTTGAIDRKAIAEAIGKSAQQVGNLLNDNYSFAGTVAREIEDRLKVPSYYLDGTPDFWPFTKELQRALTALSEDDLVFAENALRAHLRMSPIARPTHTENQSRVKVSAQIYRFPTRL